MRTLTGYGVGIVLALAVLNFLAWSLAVRHLHAINIFSCGFALGAFGMYLAASLYGYRKLA